MRECKKEKEKEKEKRTTGEKERKSWNIRQETCLFPEPQPLLFSAPREILALNKLPTTAAVRLNLDHLPSDSRLRKIFFLYRFCFTWTPSESRIRLRRSIRSTSRTVLNKFAPPSVRSGAPSCSRRLRRSSASTIATIPVRSSRHL